ncbi:Xaa-Pro aminopeptidase 1 [Cichlidogyrus casuarinus]|uniref:Xaa-Pro aminopeptidase 1 n=1 Tax=Cichlidogyrus casuarinus TaxID=1844966 RepID=A0ABD2PKH8_9PLAT
MKKLDLSAYFVPSYDEHFLKYAENSGKRRAFISGFDGSNGQAVITLDKAALWTDSRYWLEAEKVLDDNWTLMKSGFHSTEKIEDWIRNNLGEDGKIGFDPYLLPNFEYLKFDNALRDSDKVSPLVPVEKDLVDLTWNELSSKPSIDEPFYLPRSQKPANSIESVPIVASGVVWTEKIRQIRFQMSQASTKIMVFSALEDIAWVMNLRGSDIPMSRLFYSYLIVTKSRVLLYLQKPCIDCSGLLLDNLKKENSELEIRFYSHFRDDLKEICASSNDLVWFDIGASVGLTSTVPRDRKVQNITPAARLRAIKNNSELRDIREMCVHDSLVLCELYAWLEDTVRAQVKNGDKYLDFSLVESLPGLPAMNHVNEAQLADSLEKFRMTKSKFIVNSFATIAAIGLFSPINYSFTFRWKRGHCAL